MSDKTPWDHYVARIAARGGNSRRAVSFQREVRYLQNKIPATLSYHEAIIDGEPRSLAIINSDNFNEKTLCSLPGEDLPHGGIVEWMNNHWLITEKDANNELYTKAKMLQCNYLLRWVNEDKVVQERWCVIEDGTKYLTGEYGDRYFVVNRGDSRISMTLPRDSETVKLDRKSRFIIDDYDSPDPIAYRLTKPFKLGGTYNQEGVFKFVLTECNSEDDDDLVRHIADYYKAFPEEFVCVNYADCTTRPPAEDEQGWTVIDGNMQNPGRDDLQGKKVWL